jgi:hypothetical protein
MNAKEICDYFKKIQGCSCGYTKEFCACVLAVEKALKP